MVRIEGLLTPDQVAHCRQVLGAAAWADGRATAGTQSSLGKRNLQLPQDAPQAKALGELILGALARNATFMSAALPLRVFPPLFNRYDEAMAFAGHIDNAVRYAEGSPAPFRTDLSCTLFLSDPADYDGGELVIEGGYEPSSVKLPAGDLIVYTATTVHRVETISRGSRWAAVFWVQSMIRDEGRRALLHDMDRAIAVTREALSDTHPSAISLTGAYHNLIRMWSEL